MNPIKIMCQLDENGYFTGVTFADLCQITQQTYLIPAGCIEADPPPLQKGYAIKWDGQKWLYTPDLRGTVTYSKQNGRETIIEELGEIPDDLTQIPRPDAYHTWNEATGTWETSAELQAAKLADWRANVAEITPKQLRLVLLENGINAKAVEAAIASIPDETTREVASIEWNFATGYQRNNENLIMIATDLLGLDALKIDAMWQAALLK